MEKQYKHQSELVLTEASLSFKNQLTNIENILNQFANSQIVLSEDARNHESISSLIKIYQDLSMTSGLIFYTSTHGEYYQGLANEMPAGFNPVEQDWYNLAISKHGEIVWTEPYLDFVTQKIIITAARTVPGPSGIEGVIGVSFNLETLSDQISKARIGEDGVVMLLNQSGTIIASRDNYMIGEGLFGSQFKKMIQRTSENNATVEIDDTTYLVRSDMIRQDGMSIVTGISEKEIFFNSIKGNSPIFIGGVIIILVFSTIAYLAALKAVRPLEKLGRLMGSVERGNYEVQANVHDYAEISRLSSGFNNMIKGIKKRDEELLISNNGLKRAEEELRSKYEEVKESQTILKASEEKILRLASHDSLTGLLNRRSLTEILHHTLERKNNGDLTATIFLDLDNFKTVNDTLGHSFGDQLIIEVANKLTSLSAPNKQVARISGDEFILIIHDIQSEKEAEDVAKEIKNLFDAPIVIEDKMLNITASIGIALHPIHASTSEELLQNADMAMYHAKDAGKNEYRIYDATIKQGVEDKLKIELGIRQALINDEFELFYQPLYSTVEGRVTSIEALLRTNSPALSDYNTFQIIQTAEVTGQIVNLDKWVLKQACHVIQVINSRLEQPIAISINISASHIMQQDFVNNVKEIIEASAVRPEWIKLEITETSLMESFDSNKQKLEELKKLGISFHLDDFGTGYSSLHYLNNLPIDRVKIDKSFVDKMFQSEKDKRMIEMIIYLAHNIGLEVVAEGVEDRNQFEILQDYQCEILQGYFISKPVSFDEILTILQQSYGITQTFDV